MHSTGQIHPPLWGWGHYAEEKGKGRVGFPCLFLELEDLASVSIRAPGPRALDSGPTALGSWRDLGGTGRAAGTGHGGLRGQSNYQPVLVHVLGAFRA